MDFDDYQKQAMTTDLSKNIGDWNDPKNFEKLLGVCGETGELADKFKKIIRDKGGVVSDDDRAELVKELGDVLWYLAVIARHLNVDFSEVAKLNNAKLASRHERNLIHGEGDNR